VPWLLALALARVPRHDTGHGQFGLPHAARRLALALAALSAAAAALAASSLAGGAASCALSVLVGAASAAAVGPAASLLVRRARRLYELNDLLVPAGPEQERRTARALVLRTRLTVLVSLAAATLFLATGGCAHTCSESSGQAVCGCSGGAALLAWQLLACALVHLPAVGSDARALASAPRGDWHGVRGDILATNKLLGFALLPLLALVIVGTVDCGAAGFARAAAVLCLCLVVIAGPLLLAPAARAVRDGAAERASETVRRRGLRAAPAPCRGSYPACRSPLASVHATRTRRCCACGASCSFHADARRRVSRPIPRAPSTSS
jgi:hypothetical protein